MRNRTPPLSPMSVVPSIVGASVPALPATYNARVKVPAGMNVEEADELTREAASYNTRRAYKSDWRIFESWCQSQGLSSLPATEQTLAMFNTARAKSGCTLNTIQRGMLSVRVRHRAENLPEPYGLYLRHNWMGLRKKYYKQLRQATPLTAEDIRRMVDALGLRTLRAKRNRALLLIGFAAGMRRSEISALKVEDLRWQKTGEKRGVYVRIAKSKTDQVGVGRTVGIRYINSAYCPADALESFLLSSGITKGHIFLGIRGRRFTKKRLDPTSINALVAKLAQRIGIASDKSKRYTAHSLRAGLVTVARQNGQEEHEVMQTTGHTNLQQFRGYDRQDPMDASLSPYLGL